MSPAVDKKRKWIVTSAWPYVNATPHLGNLIGSVLSGDVFVRYVRQKGDEAIYVSGSDEHGTPVAVSALEQNMTPDELTKINHAKIKELFERWLISYDNYTHTHNPTHIKFTQDFYNQVEKNGFTFIKEENALYCEKDELFLPDRFVEGSCPHCKSEFARGDQCDSCGKLLTPDELINPRCKICKNSPIKMPTKHWYMDFSKTEKAIRDFVENNTFLPPNSKQSGLQFLDAGLPSRAITRDLKWGIPATFQGADKKTIYVWFEAVLGYVSAVKEWAEKIVKDPKKFEYFWNDPETRPVYFIGKDNIIFHIIIFPGLLYAFNHGLPKNHQLTMPFNVSSTEFLMYENDKFSKSRKIGIWIDEALEIAPVEYWRYSLLRNRPEKSDNSFSWEQFEKDILEVNDIIGNFIHRVLSFIEKQYDSMIPEAPKETELDDLDRKLIEIIAQAPKKAGDLLENFQLKDALNEIISIARQGNVYINDKAPWKLIKNDKQKAGYVFYLSIQLVRTLGILLYPYIPNIAEKILKGVGITNDIVSIGWDSASELKLEAGQKIPPAMPFFAKLDIKAMQAKLAEIHGVSIDEIIPKKEKSKKETETLKPIINYSAFEKFEFKIGTVLDAEPVEGSDMLLKLLVDVGEAEPRTLVAGISRQYTPENIVSTQVIVLANLEPKEIKGIMSNGMLLAADLKKKGAALLRPAVGAPNGSKIQ